MKGSYFHKVQYYETDAMGIVHHSNYIRWLEEARLDCLKENGFAYDALEERGILIPVLSVSCEYKVSVRYGQTVRIDYVIDFLKGIKFGVTYKIYSGDGSVLHATGSSTHCFLDRDLKPFNAKKKAPDVYEFFAKNVEKTKEGAN